MMIQSRFFLAFATLLFTCSLSAQTEFFSEQGSLGGAGAAPARHTITVDAGDTVEVVVFGNDIDTTLEAVLPSGETLYNDDYDGLNAGFVRSIKRGGDLVVTVDQFGQDTGNYRIVARRLPPAAQIAIGESVSARLAEGAGSGDRYQLSGGQGDRVSIELNSYDFDAYLTLIDSSGNETIDDDGGDEGTNSRLNYIFDMDETVTIVAGSFGSMDSGRYELIVSALSNEVAARYEGRLEASDSRGYDGTIYDRYEIEGKAGETVTLSLESSDFDSVLYISNPDGSNLARDDDGGDGRNSLAVVTLVEDGTHGIYVTSLSGSTGSYVLTIYH